jgi:hypothetical protein
MTGEKFIQVDAKAARRKQCATNLHLGEQSEREYSKC